MRAVLVSLCLVAAPVPRHLFPPPPPDPIRVGFRWYFQCYELEVVWAEGDSVRYRCVNVPGKLWRPCPDFPGLSEQTRQQTRDEAIRYGVPRVWHPLHP